MIRKVLAVAVTVTFVAASGAAWAQVAAGANTVPKYPDGPPPSKNRTHTKHGVGGNFVPEYPKMAASKNRTHTKHGVGGNFVPEYPKTGTH
jgi:hypothetical protein